MTDAADTTSTATLKNQRKGHRSYVTRKITEVSSLMRETDLHPNDVNKIEAIRDTLEVKLKTLSDLDEKILDVTPDEKIEEEIVFSSEHTEKVKLVMREIQTFIKDREGVRKYAKLPNIVIPSFRGDPREFQRFWQLYESTIHKNPKLDPIQKFAYLSSFLEGEAKNAVRGIRQCEEGYPQLVQALLRRFNRPELVKDLHINALLELRPVEGYNDHRKLRGLYDEINGHINSLSAVNVHTEDVQTVLVPVIMRSFPKALRVDIKESLDALLESNMEAVLEKLLDHISVRERSESQTPQSKQQICMSQRASYHGQ